MLRPLRRHGPLWLALLCATGCGTGRSGTRRSTVSGDRTIITAEKIAASGAKTAWEAVRFTVPNLQFRESGGQPARILRRGRASIYLDDQVRVMLDNNRVYDLTMLDQIPASDVLVIEVLNGLDATTHYGGNSTSGLLIIRTKTGN